MKNLTKWLLVLLIVISSGIYGSGIDLREDALDLLPDGIRSTDLQMLQSLGMVNRVYLTLSLDSPCEKVTDAQWQVLRESADRVGSLLQTEPLLDKVMFRLSPGYAQSIVHSLWQSLPVLLEKEDYHAIKKSLAGEGLHEQLTRDFLLLNSPAGIGLKSRVQHDPLGLSTHILERLKQLRGEFAITIIDGFFANHARTSCLLIAESRLPLTDSHNAQNIQNVIDQALSDGIRPGVSATIIGTLPHTLANIETVNRDLRILLPAASLLLVVFLLLFFRDFRAILVVLIPFLAAPPAIAVLHFVYPRTSALALGFGIVLLGVAVDFSVHIYVALSRAQESAKATLKNLQRPIFMALCTTSGVFGILLFSSVPSHRQMALLALTGVFLAVLVSWLLVPTIAPKKQLVSVVMPKPVAHNFWRVTVAVVWLFIIAAGVFCWPRIHYNGDMRVLDATNEHVKRDEARFYATWRQSTEQAFLVATGNSLDQALSANDLVYSYLRKNNADHFQSVAPLLPGLQTQDKRIALWKGFWQPYRNKLELMLDNAGEQVGFRKGSFTPFLEFIDTLPINIDAQAMLNGPLRPLLQSLVHAPVSTDNNEAASFMVMTVVPENDLTLPILEGAGRLENIHILSLKSWRLQVEHLLRSDFSQLALSAFLLVLAIVVTLFRDTRKVAAALAPVGAALAAMVLFTCLSGRDLNIMHVLMGIMVIGLSVDYGIFTVYAQESDIPTTIRTAIFICAVSTCIGFGVLAFARHPALNALGTTVLVGIGMALPTALWVSPLFLQNGRRR